MKRARRGISLSELLVVMTACTALMTLSSQLVCRVMRIQVESRGLADAERNTMRLAGNFRSDVHRAQSFAIDPAAAGEAPFLRIVLAGGRSVAYSRQSGAVLRQESGAEQPTAREEFKLPAAAELNVRELDSPQRLELTLSVDPAAQLRRDGKSVSDWPLIPVSLQAEAIVSRDSQFASGPAVEESAE
jgi:hypothetical protein